VTVAPAPSPWFTWLRKPERAAARVVLFPQAGGGVYALAGLVPLLPPDVEVLSLALPGRDRRFGEPPRTDPCTVLDETETALRSLPPVPTLLFGCSVGALLATRAAARLTDACSALVVAGQLPGDHHRRPLHATGTAALTQVLAEAGDTPAAVLADADFAASLLNRLDADLRLGRAAESAFDDVRCDAPILAIGGLTDPFVSPGLLPGWAAHTHSTCTLLTLPGGHFAFLEPPNRPLVGAVLGHVLAGLPDPIGL
jgi:surfactin synthase thioesterase subunit